MKFVRILLILPFFLAAISLQAQKGTISGRVIDGMAETEEGLINAQVKVYKDSTLVGGAITDFDGNYSVQPQLTPGSYQVMMTYLGYDTIRKEVAVLAGQSTAVNEIMKEAETGVSTGTVTIRARQIKNSDIAILKIQQKAPAVMDFTSNEQMKRTGDSDVGSAMKRVTGVTVEGGKYVYVRGLGDRYSKTTLNGAEIPGLDPDRNTVQMDMFPSALIQNVAVYKSFTPDLPASFSGGLVDITTKDFPERLTLAYSGSLGYNTQSSFQKDYLTYQTGKTDFLGFDDGTRAVPSPLDRPTFILPDISFSDQAKAEAIDEASKAFQTNIFPTTGNSFMNQNHSLSFGNSTRIKGRPFGFLASLSYRNNFNFYDNGVSGRYKLTGNVDSTRTLTKLLRFDDTRASSEVLWGGLVNFSYRPTDNIGLSFNYMHNQSGESYTRALAGELPDDDPNLIFETRVLGYLQRSLDVFQFIGVHEFPEKNNMRFDYTGTFTLSSQEEPDLRFFSNDYVISGDDTLYDIQRNLYNPPSRYFRRMDERNADLKTNLEIPFLNWNEQDSKIKTGAALTYKDRDFREDRYEINTNSDIDYTGDPESYFSDENMGIIGIDTFNTGGNTTYTYNYGHYLTDATQRQNNYDGTQMLAAAYAMTELPLSQKLKFVGGARYELTNITVASQDLSLREGNLVTHDVLPSANLIFNPFENANIRLGYSRTLARPTFRELAPYASFEFVRDFVLIGNDSLQRTLVDNGDIRFEWFPESGEILSVSGFYKNFTNPIEKVINPVAANTEMNYRNVDNAWLVGMEFEVRKGLGFITPALNDFRVGANLSLIKSQLDINPAELALIRTLNPGAAATRDMFGQSPYMVNAELAYKNDSTGWMSSLNFNVFGARISEVSIGGTPNVYEQPRPTLDFTLQKSFQKDYRDVVSIRFRARNLLNPEYKKTHTYRDQEYIFQSFQVGRTFSLGVSWNIL